MVFQQFGGINGIGFYVSETFVSAGLSSGKIGLIAYGCIQVCLQLLFFSPRKKKKKKDESIIPLIQVM